MNQTKKKIAIIFGGCSAEYSVSLQSAYAVICHLDREKYTPVLIGISRQGDWYYFNGDIEKIPGDDWCTAADCLPVAVSPNRLEHALLKYTDNHIEKIHIDAAFPVLHGKNGEDGTVQGIFALAGIPLVGCGVLSSALCMDKDRAHKLAYAAGVSVPRSGVFHKNTEQAAIFSWAEEIGYPLFVKPLQAGSSLGVTKVWDCSHLLAAVKSAFFYDDNIILEENITGFEVGCAIMGMDSLIIGEIDEIQLTDGFFDYREKYTLETAAIHVPARVDADTAKRIKQTAVTIYRALDCCGFARVDMFLSTDGKIVFNEVNTIPGFTTHSRFPNMLKAVGMSFAQIISNAVEQAVAR